MNKRARIVVFGLRDYLARYRTHGRHRPHPGALRPTGSPRGVPEIREDLDTWVNSLHTITEDRSAYVYLR